LSKYQIGGFALNKFKQRLAKGLVAFTLMWLTSVASGDEIGSVDTKLRPLSTDDSIRIESLDDPDVSGVACYLSRAQVGGYGGALGISEDTSDASLDCRQVGPIKVTKNFKPGQSLYTEKRSLIFKSLRVIRFCDSARNAIVYLAYSERLVDGSPKNSVSAVPIRAWPGDSSPIAKCSYKN